MKVGLEVNIAGCEVVKVWLTTEVMIGGLELTIVVGEGGLVCVTLLVVGFIVVLIGYGTVELEASGFKVV